MAAVVASWCLFAGAGWVRGVKVVEKLFVDWIPVGDVGDLLMEQ